MLATLAADCDPSSSSSLTAFILENRLRGDILWSLSLGDIRCRGDDFGLPPSNICTLFFTLLPTILRSLFSGYKLNKGLDERCLLGRACKYRRSTFIGVEDMLLQLSSQAKKCEQYLLDQLSFSFYPGTDPPPQANKTNKNPAHCFK